jgi:hypothetical protein
VSDGDASVFETPALLRVIWADPQNMAEHIALWSLKYFGPRADASVARLRREHPGARREELEPLVIAHQTRVAMTEGAFVGGPFLVLIPVAFCAAMLAQAQMALEQAALAGYAPVDAMRAADLLVLQGAYATTADAHAALDKVALEAENRDGKRLPRGTRVDMIKRMAYLLGVLGSGDPGRSRLRNTLGWVGVGLVVVVGLVLPLVWVPYMASAMRRSALRMGTRASEFYSTSGSSEAGVAVKPGTVRVAISASLVRMLVLILIPVAVAVVAWFTDTNLLGGRWVSAVIFLLALSVLTTLGWLAYRWWRR